MKVCSQDIKLFFFFTSFSFSTLPHPLKKLSRILSWYIILGQKIPQSVEVEIVIMDASEELH